MREMKDSGVEWIGEIPKDWGIIQIKKLLVARDGGSWGEEPQEDQLDRICYRVADFDFSRLAIVSDAEFTIRNYSQPIIDKLSLERGDILVEKSGGGDKTPVGRAVFFDKDEPALFANFIERLRVATETSPRYFFYVWIALYLTGVTNNYIKQTTGIQNLDIKSLVSSVYVPSFDLNLQYRIADNIDTKCAQIDRAIARQQEVIEKLKEYKLSVITEAVTKGLNPDVPMKDSGIEWIGEIPEHWEVSALKNYIDVLPGYAFSSLDFDIENGIPLLRGVNVTPNGLRWDDVVYWNKSISDELEPFALCKNDIVFGLDRPWINEGTRITIISENDLPCLLLQRVCRIRATEDLDFRIAYYWLGSTMFQNIVSLATTGVSVPHISTRQIGNYIIAVPPKMEQKQICEYLDSSCSKIDNNVIQKSGIINKLTEYKKSLIYEVVTGKREV
jgi:type I restriction enzyme S subunit